MVTNLFHCEGVIAINAIGTIGLWIWQILLFLVTFVFLVWMMLKLIRFFFGKAGVIVLVVFIALLTVSLVTAWIQGVDLLDPAGLAAKQN